VIKRLKQIAAILTVLFTIQGFGLGTVLCFETDGSVALESRTITLCQNSSAKQTTLEPTTITCCPDGCTDILLCDRTWRPEFSQNLAYLHPIMATHFIKNHDLIDHGNCFVPRADDSLPSGFNTPLKTIILLI